MTTLFDRIIGAPWAMPIVSRPWALAAVITERAKRATGYRIGARVHHRAWEHAVGVGT